MMQHRTNHLRQLKGELVSAHEHLQQCLGTNLNQTTADTVAIDGLDVRLAVERVRAVLTEIRKLK